jgi:hypothetical protein
MNLKLSSSVNRKKSGVGKKIGIAAAGTVAVLAVGYVLTANIAFGNRFLPGTVIDGIDCGFATVDKARQSLENVISDYSLEVTDGNTTDVLSAADISLTGNFDNELNSALEEQSKLSWVVGLFKKKELQTAPVVSYDEEKLSAKISEFGLVTGEGVTDSVNAYAKLNDSNRYEIVPEVYGTRLDTESFSERMKEAVSHLETTIDLTSEDLYIKPTVYSDNEAMNNAVTTANKWLDSVVTYTFGSAQEVADASVTKDWIVIGDDFSTYFDRDGVKEFVRGLSRKYDTFGDTRTIPTTYGFDVSVVAGNYGYRINRDAEIDALVADLKTGEKKDRTPIYYQEGASYDGLDIGNTYVEVDLTGQHLFLYKDGALILQSEIVSAHPAKGETPNGTYRITYCERNAVLRGDNYETPVDYWMPFNGDIGLHDASWQAKFGGDWYVTHGSHGCVNLPPDIAKQIFSYAYTGMPVVCYRYDTSHYNAVNNYRKSVGLETIFDTQSESSTEAASA